MLGLERLWASSVLTASAPGARDKSCVSAAQLRLLAHSALDTYCPFVSWCAVPFPSVSTPPPAASCCQRRRRLLGVGPHNTIVTLLYFILV